MNEKNLICSFCPNDISVDEDTIEIVYEDFILQIEDTMNDREYWKIDGKNMGWLNRIGYKYVNASTGEELIQSITGNYDWSAYVYSYYSGMKVIVYTHDSPMGETYYIKPVSEKEYEKNK